MALPVAWLHVKLVLVAVLIAYHIYCGKLLADFKHDRNRHGHVWYRWFNEFPVLILIAVVVLAVVNNLTSLGRLPRSRAHAVGTEVVGFAKTEATGRVPRRTALRAPLRH